MIEEDCSILLAAPDVRLEVLAQGGTMRRFEVRLPDGSWRNIVLGAQDPSDYRGIHRYVGATVGRVANRIALGRFPIDQVSYVVDVNEPPNQLHGGRDGFSFRDWSVAGRGPDWVELSLDSANGDQGFPGELSTSARYELVPGGVQVTYRATTTGATVVNLTTHPFFNLSGEGSGNTDDHVLTVHASRYTPTHRDGVPTGEIRDVASSAVDFRVPRAFGAARVAAAAEGLTRNDGFDHNFVVDGEGMREHCRLVAPDGLAITVVSDQPALQVYGGEHFDGSQVGTSGVPYGKRAGIALETQGFPDAPNHPNFPSIVLRPGEEYVATTRWLVS